MKNSSTMLAALLLCASSLAAGTSDTAFTYQGRLRDGGLPANGAHTMSFALWDAATLGAQVGATVSVVGQSVTNGLFAAELDFGADVYDGTPRWLEISVDSNTLAPRQAITSAPFSVQTRGLVVDAFKNVGIGTTQPDEPLHVAASFGVAIKGEATNVAGFSRGVYGISNSPIGSGVFGEAAMASADSNGVEGVASLGSGVRGTGSANGGCGVRGVALGTPGRGVFGEALASSGVNYGVRGESASTTGRGVFGQASASSGSTVGVFGRSDSATGHDFFAGGIGIDFGSNSSRRWKGNVRNIDAPLDKLAQLRGVYYDWDEEHGGHHDVGMIAEEVGAVLPEIVSYEENGVDAIGMDYSKLTPLLVEAVNALRAENEALRARLEALEEERRTDGGQAAGM